MVHEPKLKPLLEDARRSLEQIGRALIAAANEAGGRDNITVILFRLEEVEDRRGDAGGAAPSSPGEPTAEYDTFAGEAPAPRQGVSRPTAAHAPAADDAAEAEYRRARHRRAAGDPRAERRRRGAAAPAREPPRAHRAAARTAAAAGAAARSRRRAAGPAARSRSSSPLLVGGWLATRAVYFVGTDPRDGRTVDDLPRAAVRAAVRDRPLRALRRAPA